MREENIAKMKNLFDYATKELSQDAFLRWLFENHNCENESIKKAFRKLFDSFTANKFKNKEVTHLKTVAQWKNIDISIWFKVDNEEYLIVIEDKTGSDIHGDQLEKYNQKIKEHNDYWKSRGEAYRTERYLVNEDNIFKVFYKTNIIEQWEKSNAEKCGWTNIYDINDIYALFSDIDTDNEVLGYYKEHIKKIHSDANRHLPPGEWGLISWHSFFNSYNSLDCISEKKEIDCYQNDYFYIKFFVKGHEKDMPCFEIRSRDFKYSENRKNHSILLRVVLYNLSNQADKQTIKLWQESLKNHGFKLNYRNDVSTHKQIGTMSIENIGNTEADLRIAFDRINNLLSLLF